MPRTPADQLPQNDDGWRERLTPTQFEVARKAGTERAFTGEYWDCHDDGTYVCVCCDAPLFSSDTKFESGTGWPSFFQAVDSRRGRGDDGPEPRHGPHRGRLPQLRRPPRPRVPGRAPARPGLRYCMNSASLRLDGRPSLDRSRIFAGRPDPSPGGGDIDHSSPEIAGDTRPGGRYLIS